MPISNQRYSENEAWLAFQLNEEPIFIKPDGDFNVYSVMDVATGLILGREFLKGSLEELSEIAARRLLASSESEAGVRPKYLLVDAEQNFNQLAKVATVMGIKVIAETASILDPTTREAKYSFAAYLRNTMQ